MNVYNSEEIKQIDARAEAAGLSTFTLMENAGRSLYEKITTILTRDQTIGIAAGIGNNGGDGIVLARYLQTKGYDVTLMFPFGKPKSDAAKKHLQYYKSLYESPVQWTNTLTFDVIVDSLFGISLRFPLDEAIWEWIEWANNQSALRIAVDMPTGVLANEGRLEQTKVKNETGQTKRIPFKADYTFSLHGAKPSAFLYPAASYYGKLKVVSIGLTETSQVRVTKKEEVEATIPQRISFGHKGSFGTGLLVAGSVDMPGSVTLSAIGSIRSGIGRLIVATEREVIPVVAAHVPEATFISDGLKQISAGNLPESIAAVGIGPGLEDEELTNRALDELMKTRLPLVVDAGALQKRTTWDANGPIVLTPHPGEFHRLTSYSTDKIQENRLQLARQYAKDRNVILVLKGEYTVIASPDGRAYINPTGNSSLAKGGSGDVLTGIIVSFLATYDCPFIATRNAVYIHGLCADLWAERYSEESMTASDFAILLPKAFKKLTSNSK